MTAPSVPESDPIKELNERRKFRPLWVAEWNWKRWGLGLEFSLGYWWPREWSIYLIVGPVLLGGGMEERFDD